MPNIVHVRDKEEGKILERYAIDAREIVASDPDRFEIVGNVPTEKGSVAAVLDNDPPTEVARKILAAAGVEAPKDESVSDEVADEDIKGNPVNEAADERGQKKRKGHKAKPKSDDH
jgi:hypothetical protein